MRIRDERIAQPGDEDLDLDVDGMTLTAVVVEGGEILVRATGGFGWWIGTEGELAEFPPGDPNACVDVMDLRLLLDEPDSDWFKFFVAKLEGWRDQATPLRLCSAPSRMGTLIEDKSSWLPIPRRPHPTWTD